MSSDPEERRRRPVVANPQYGGEYGAEIEEAQRTGECIFCKPEFREKGIFSFGGWFVVHNSYPTKDREGQHPAFQFLFVSKGHGDDEGSFCTGDWGDVLSLLELCKRRFGIDGGCLFARDGDPLLSGRTIQHPHVHYYVPRVVRAVGDAAAHRGLRAVPIDIPAG